MWSLMPLGETPGLKLVNALLCDDGVEGHVPCLDGNRIDLLKGVRHANQQRADRSGIGDGAVVEATALSEALTSLIERNEGNEDDVMTRQEHRVTTDGFIDSEAAGNRFGRRRPWQKVHAISADPRNGNQRAALGQVRERCVEADFTADRSVAADDLSPFECG